MKGQACPAARGFTLMEMLVTLVIFALVSGLLWQAMATVARLETHMVAWTRNDRDTALREEWLRELLRGLVTGARGDPLTFLGDRSRLEGYSTMPPWPGVNGPHFMKLHLRTDEVAGRTTLVVQEGAGGQELELFVWPAMVHFEYLDDTGIWHENWSPAPEDAVPLPNAVRLAGPPGGDFLVAVQAMVNPMLRRVELEQP